MEATFSRGTTQDNPPKHKSNALPSCVKFLLVAVILTYECQQSVGEIPLGTEQIAVVMVTGQVLWTANSRQNSSLAPAIQVSHLWRPPLPQ